MSNHAQDTLLPPLLPNTPDDHGGYVVVTSILLLILTFLSVGVAFTARVKILGSLLISDWVLATATIIFLAESICIRYACFYGLGRHRMSLTDTSFEQYSKYLYASQILSHLCVACTKLSMVLLLISIKPLRHVLIACYYTFGLISLWCLSGIFALAFQCDPPRPWDFTPGRCLNQEGLYTALDIGSIITDLAIVILTCALIMQVQLSPKKRVTIAALFSTRIIVVVCTAISLARYSPFFHFSPIDQPWQAVDPLIWTQAVLSVSIITACVPGLKRVLADLRTGLMAGAVTEFYELSVSGEMGRSCLSDTQNSNKETASRKGYPGENSFLPTNNSYQRGRARCDYKNKGNTPNPLKEQRASSFATGGSRKLKTDSVENLTDNEIIQTMEYEVRFEDRR